jgi:uncharacterized protein (TIGR02453 family)
MKITIEKSTLEFLKKLKANNNKDWFDKNRAAYDDARSNFHLFVQQLIAKTAKADPAIGHLEANKCTFRINRDIRFSNDKTPYKTNLAATMSPGGKKSFTAGYYLHIEPGGSFVAGGMWQPEAPLLQAIRQEIDYNAEEFRAIIDKKDFKKHFGKLYDGDKLKTVPKGYDKTHPEIDLLRHRSFLAEHYFTDKEILSDDFLDQVVTMNKGMLPLNVFLRRAVS